MATGAHPVLQRRAVPGFLELVRTQIATAIATLVPSRGAPSRTRWNGAFRSAAGSGPSAWRSSRCRRRDPVPL